MNLNVTPANDRASSNQYARGRQDNAHSIATHSRTGNLTKPHEAQKKRGVLS